MTLTLLRRLLEDTRHTVCWTATDGQEAVRKAQQNKPDLILMDLLMPVMDGVAATQAIMQQSPVAILVVTASVDHLSDRVFSALAAGALDAVNTPVLGNSSENCGGAPLLAKIETISKLLGERTPRPDPVKLITKTVRSYHSPPLIVIGASSGGPGALVKVLAKLPPVLPAAVVVVQHIDAEFTQGLAHWLGSSSPLPVALAIENQKPRCGHVALAGTQSHLVIGEDGTFRYQEHPDSVHRPSIDVFFKSVAQNWVGPVIGVILTGMGKDGAQGLLSLHQKGHYTIAQDEATSAIFGMPRAAIEQQAVSEILPLEAIGPSLVQWLKRHPAERKL